MGRRLSSPLPLLFSISLFLLSHYTFPFLPVSILVKETCWTRWKGGGGRGRGWGKINSFYTTWEELNTRVQGKYLQYRVLQLRERWEINIKDRISSHFSWVKESSSIPDVCTVQYTVLKIIWISALIPSFSRLEYRCNGKCLVSNIHIITKSAPAVTVPGYFYGDSDYFWDSACNAQAVADTVGTKTVGSGLNLIIG